MNRRITQLVCIVLAVFGLSGAAALTTEGDRPRVAVVVVGSGTEDAAAIAKARELAEDRDAQLRVVRTLGDQLGATHLFAVQKYDYVLTIGVDRRIAIDPVAARYPGTRFVELSASTYRR